MSSAVFQTLWMTSMKKMNVSTAVSTKAKAMFGKRLRAKDYQELARKRSLAEIAGYLKSETYYDSILDGVNEQSIHRGYFEQIIRYSYFIRLGSLLRYVNGADSIITFGVFEIELQQILLVLYSFNRHERSEQIAQLPLSLDKYIEFNLSDLVSVSSIDDLYKVIKGSIYGQAILPYLNRRPEELDLFAIEVKMKSIYFDKIQGLISTNFEGKEKKELLQIFNTKIELENISKIYRLKKYYQLSAAQIRDVIKPISVRIPIKDLHEMIENCTADELIDALAETSYRSYIDISDFLYIENSTNRIEYRINKSYLQFSTSTNVVIVCYLFLLQQEIQNLIDIIEGVRYNLSSEKIDQMLIY